MIKNVVFILFLLFFTGSCYAGDCDDLNKNTCDILKNFTVADTNNELRFNHPCSSLDNNNQHYRTAYAFFEATGSGTEDYKALILAEVGIGWIGSSPNFTPKNGELPPAEKGIFLDLQRMQIQSLEEWAGAPFTIALQVRNNRTNKVVTGPASKTFFYSHQGSGYPEDKPYTVATTGNLFWEQLKEPEEEEKEEKDSQTEAQFCAEDCNSPDRNARRNEYRGSQGIDLMSTKIPHPKDPHTLYIVLKNQKTGAEIKLQGPIIEDLKSQWDIKYSGPQKLSFFDILWPFQEGGLWDYIGDAIKYGDCIHLRKQAKKEFSTRLPR